MPRGEKPATGWPVVIFNHGYIPPDQYRTTERYVAYVDGFARNGYIVFRSDYRGHGDSEGEASGAYGSPDYTVDVLNAVSAMKQYPDADPNRIGMWGHSMGGYITLRSMVIQDDIKAGVIWAGVVASYPDMIAELATACARQHPPTRAALAERMAGALRLAQRRTRNSGRRSRPTPTSQTFPVLSSFIMARATNRCRTSSRKPLPRRSRRQASRWNCTCTRETTTTSPARSIWPCSGPSRSSISM